MPGLVGSLLGLGNPLLDVCADVDQKFLDQYDVRGSWSFVETWLRRDLGMSAAGSDGHLRVAAENEQPDLGRGEAPTYVQGILDECEYLSSLQ